MRRFAIAAFILIGVAPALANEGPFKAMSFDDALKAAKKDNKIVLVDFYTTWCGPCKKLDKQTWPDKAVQAWLAEKTIALRIDAEKEADLASKYNVGAYPTILLVKPDGKEIDRLIGFRSPEDFIKEANSALGGKDSVTRAKDELKGKENDPMVRMKVGDALAQKGKYKEALDEYLWCFDHGNEHSMGFAGVRLSFLLSDIVRIGRSYPPAIEELKKRRDLAQAILEGKKQVSAGNGEGMPKSPGMQRSPRQIAATEFTSISRELKDQELILKIFGEISKSPKVDPLVSEILIREIIDPLLKAKRYGEIASAIKGGPEKVDEQINRCKQIISMTSHVKGDENPGGFFRESTITDCVKYYEAFLGAAKTKEADKMADKVIEFDKTGKTFAMLINHAVRAGKNDSARALANRASKELKGEELSIVQKAAGTIPPA